MKKPRKKKQEPKDKENQTTKQEDLLKEDERKVDYGGLPVRDLKKNLGCG